MECTTAAELILWYPSGSLSQADRAELGRHTLTCAACRSELARTMALGRALEQALDQQPAAPPDLRGAVMRATLDRPTPRAVPDLTRLILKQVLPPVARAALNPLAGLPDLARRWLPQSI